MSLLDAADALDSVAVLQNDASTDPDDVGIPDAAAVRIELIDCVAPTVAVDTDLTPTVDVLAADGAYLKAGGDSSGSSSPEPTLNSEIRRPAINRGEYGKRFRGDNSHVGATWFLYGTVDRDTRGRPLIAWQNVDAYAGDETRFTRLQALEHQEGGPTTPFDASTPLGEKPVEASQGYDLTLKFGVEKKDTGSAEASVSRQIFIERSVFGGANLRSNDGDVYAHQGGFSKINKDNGGLSRAWSQGAAWTFPPGSSQSFTLSIAWRYNNR